VGMTVNGAKKFSFVAVKSEGGLKGSRVEKKRKKMLDI
jgi:hypothetical protein